MKNSEKFKINTNHDGDFWRAVESYADSKAITIKKSQRFVLLLLVFLVLVQGILYPQLDKLYKNGVIKMVADASFGAQTDWESLFYDTYKSMAIAPDGCIFISNDRQNSIYKLSASGKLLKQWGQSGAGPSDLTNPGDLSILDGKYLVVGEYATLRRISLFNLDGKYEKILRTNHSCFAPLSLKDNRIAYYSVVTPDKGKEEITVWVKDVLNGKETPVTVAVIPTINQIRNQYGYTLSIKNHCANLALARTQDGNLLIGISNQPVLNIYTPQGKWIHSFGLNITPLPITSRYIKEYKQMTIKDLSERKGAGVFLEMVKKASFEKLFPSHLPYYRTISVDSQGNILVFKWLNTVKDCPIQFQVYSPTGKFLHEVLLDPGPWNVEVEENWEKLIFNNKGIFAFVQLKDDDESAPKIIKINVPLVR